MIPAVDTTCTLTFKAAGAPLCGPLASKLPKTTSITGKVVAKPHWVKDSSCFGFFVAGSPVPMRVIDVKDVIAIDGLANFTAPETKVETFEVAGSKGSVYTVTNEAGRWSCTCVGFGFRKDCKHIHQVKS